MVLKDKVNIKENPEPEIGYYYNSSPNGKEMNRSKSLLPIYDREKRFEYFRRKNRINVVRNENQIRQTSGKGTDEGSIYEMSRNAEIKRRDSLLSLTFNLSRYAI